MKILIGYDGSECADAALEDLKGAGLPKTAEALVMTMADVFLPPPINEKIDNTFPMSVRAGGAACSQTSRAQIRRSQVDGEAGV
jgi:hypothetical protein